MSKYHQETIDWEKIKKSIDDMFPPPKHKQQRDTRQREGYPLDDKETKQRVIERLRKRKEKQQQ